MRNGTICNNLCWREYCGIHINKVPFKPCTGCEKPTQSKYGMCNACSSPIRSKIKYEKQKLLA